MPSAVIDTGVIVSALIKKDGASRKAFLKAIREYALLYSIETLSELDTVLRRTKFSRLFTDAERLTILAQVIEHGELVEVVSTVSVCRDVEDNKFLNLALDGKANVIISRDPDLLILHPFQSIPILNPTSFLDWPFPEDTP